ncbi:UNVERIFIED_CONTAM: hypothetical protein FKN15_001223 [Acipenser sinensis]
MCKTLHWLNLSLREREEAAEIGAKELEGAAEELTLWGEQEDSVDEMGGELSDSSLISDIPDSQPARKKKTIYAGAAVIPFFGEGAINWDMPPLPTDAATVHLAYAVEEGFPADLLLCLLLLLLQLLLSPPLSFHSPSSTHNNRKK